MVAAVNNSELTFFNTQSAFLEEQHLLTRIFSEACAGSSGDFKAITLVSKRWREIVLYEAFYDAMVQRIAPHLFGRADYVKYIGGDPGEEFPIPLEYLIKFRPGETLLTLVPKELKLLQENGTVVVEPCNMVNIGKWALNAKEGHQIGYHPDSWREAITEERELEDSHWSFINIELIEKNKTFAEQENAVLARVEKLADLCDLSLSLLMTYVKTGVRYLNWGETDTNYQFARVPEKTQGFRLCVGFAAAGLCVYGSYYDAYAGSDFSVIVARKSNGLSV